MTRRPSALERWLLPLAMLAGLALGAYGLVAPAASSGVLPPGVVALVNGKPIARALLDAVAVTPRRGRLPAAGRRLALDKLIDEEILVQRALALGLAERDRVVRNMLVRTMLDSIAGAQEVADPNDAALRAYFQRNSERYRGQARVALRQIFVDVADAQHDAAGRARAAEAARALAAGAPFAEVAARLGDRPPVPLPDGLLPLGKLVEYLGPTAAHAAAELAPGATSAPIRSGRGYRVLLVSDRVVEPAADFSRLRAAVLADWRREARERAVATALARLRAQAAIIRGDVGG
ncbi:MAG: peptidylprolyl isomerase [Candidatus Binatia bacterium]